MPVKVNSIAEDLLNDSKLYDKIITENAHKFSPEFTQKILGLNSRKLTTHFKIAMGIVGTFKVEKDPFYQQGRREARKEERVKAAKEKKEMALEIVLKLKMKGMLGEDISELTGLSIEQIQVLG